MEIEKKLQQINKDFFFPYWDSPKQWKDADDAALWKYLGGRGKKVPNDIFGGKPFKLQKMKKPLQRAEGSLNKRLVQATAYDVATKNSIQKKTGYGVWHEELEVLIKLISNIMEPFIWKLVEKTKVTWDK